MAFKSATMNALAVDDLRAQLSAALAAKEKAEAERDEARQYALKFQNHALESANLIAKQNTVILASEARADRLDYIIGEAYQVIGALAYATGTFDAPQVQRALDYFADPEDHPDGILPWHLPEQNTE